MKLYSFADEMLDLFERVSYNAQTRKIGDIRSPSIHRFFVYHEVLLRHYFHPACFLMLFNVPSGTSFPSFPATVTVPGFTG